MAEPIQIRHLRAVKSRLSAISVANGYLTNAGENIYFGPRVHSKSNCPVINVVGGADEPQKAASGGSRSMELRQVIYVDGFVEEFDDSEESGLAGEEIKADIKQAVLDYNAQALTDATDDDNLGSLEYAGAVPIEKADNSDVEGIRVTFYVINKEGFGNPYATR